MNYFKVYKAIKSRLGSTVPVFFYTGQYQPGKEKTSYRVPAIYIELPKETPICFYGKNWWR